MQKHSYTLKEYKSQNTDILRAQQQLQKNPKNEIS